MFWLDPWTFCSIILHFIAYVDHSYATDLGAWTKIKTLPASYFQITTQNVLRCGKLCERQDSCVAVTFDNKDRICYMHDTDATNVETSKSERYMYKTYEHNPQQDADCNEETQMVVPTARKESKHCYNIKATDTTTITSDTTTTATVTTTSATDTTTTETSATSTTTDTPSSEPNDVCKTTDTPSLDPPTDCVDCRDCYDVLLQGHNMSGVYNISPTDLPVTTVFCDQDTDGGGWLVFQRRSDGSEDFFRGWADYEQGFGNLQKEFWIGNAFLATITSNRQYTLRIDLESFENQCRYAVYDWIKVGAVSTNYKLEIGDYHGTAGDGLIKKSNGSLFSTFDQNTKWCATTYRGAWWYSTCHDANLNGFYYGGNATTYADGVCWRPWLGYYYSLRRTEMKIRPREEL